MIDSLCDYKDGILVDDVFNFIEKIVAEKHQIQQFELLEDDKEDPEVLIYKEQFQDEINSLYDEFETTIIEFLKF